MKRLLHAFSLFTVLLSSLNLSSDIYASFKIKTKMDSGAESTTYIKGKRQDMELGSGMTMVSQRDMKRTAQSNQPTKTDIAATFNESENGAPINPSGNDTTSTPDERRGKIISTTNMKDKGERRRMFGFSARCIKTSMVSQTSPDAGRQDKSRTDSDGWFTDLHPPHQPKAARFPSTLPR